MIVEQIWTGNSYRNFHYLIACPESGEAMAIDPLEYQKCLACAKEKGWEITQILNTHEHPDHIGGNAEMVAATGAKLMAHENAGPFIDGMDQGLSGGDIVRVGKTVELVALDTPGHTLCHVCLLSNCDQSPALFSGDALFAAGAGNCRFGGDPEQLFNTFATQFSEIPGEVRVFPGHDYLANNLGFTLDREPDNESASALLNEVVKTGVPVVTTLAMEREINTFLRLTSDSVVDRLYESFPDMKSHPSPQEVFLRLRKLRDQW